MTQQTLNSTAKTTQRVTNVGSTKIDRYLLGHWTNKRQAQNAPHQFSQIETIWEKIDGGYHSKTFYSSNGEHNPYRERYHKAVVISDTEIHFQNFDLDWTRADKCDMIFKFDGTQWHGSLGGDECTGVRGHRIVSEIHLSGDKLHSMDKGYHLETGEMMWGSENLYKFLRK